MLPVNAQQPAAWRMLRESCSRPPSVTAPRLTTAPDGLSLRRLATCNSSRQAPAPVIQESSLIPETLRQMELDAVRPDAPGAARDRAAAAGNERRQRQRSLERLAAPSFYRLCKDNGVAELRRGAAQILQLNIGLYCNQACSHCHVDSSPARTEMMDRATAERCLELCTQPGSSISTLDITGGAPELNSQFRFLVDGAVALGLEVIDRCNLTVLLEPGQEDLVDFLAQRKVRVVASLPCYSTRNVDEQRGRGVFDRSIRGLQRLNAAGYGWPGSGLVLDLVYNPNGTFLAPPQAALEDAYKRELREAFGIEFNSLFCLNNMPIRRYADYLVRKKELQTYMAMLVDNFSASAAGGVMCRSTVNVGWDGRIFDCDFNQQLDLGMRLRHELGADQPTVFSINSLADLESVSIACDNHCFGCTAGSGSSCQGALA